MSRLVSYTSVDSLEHGESIECHVGLIDATGSDSQPYRAELVRIVGPGPATGSEGLVPIASSIDGEYNARREETPNGSYGRAQIGSLRETPLVSLQVTFMPTLIDGREQSLISLLSIERSEGLGLSLDGAGRAMLVVGDASGEPTRLLLPAPVTTHAWWVLTGGINRASGEAFVHLQPLLDGRPSGEAQRSTQVIEDVNLPQNTTVTLAARRTGEGLHEITEAFTGRLERPLVTASADTALLERTRSNGAVSSACVIALWDFSIGIGTYAIHDVSGNGHHGTLHQLPMRAVTGSNWAGTATDFREAPDQYGAIHFFADGIEEAGWPVAFALEVPTQLTPGLYGFRLTSAHDVDVVPFVVRPHAEDRADLLFLLPTATYAAYANSRWPWERVNWEVQCGRTLQLGRRELILIDHPEFGLSSYDQHADGTDVAYVSRLRPNLELRVGHHRYEAYAADLHIIDWLERSDLRYDIATDEDLNRLGPDLLASYRAVVTGSHPEYASTRALSAIDAFVRGGGRLAVLGGNTFHFRVAFSEERPWIMEVRKPSGVVPGTRAFAEARLSFTGEEAHDFIAAGAAVSRPSDDVTGISTASMGFDSARPFERLEASARPEVAFIFDGIEAKTIGAHGPYGGVVFQEWDNAFGSTPERAPMILARSSGHSVTTRWFGAVKRRNHADMTFASNDAGGAIFSASSMGWALALQTNGGDNDVARITSNVIERFLSPEPFGPSIDGSTHL